MAMRFGNKRRAFIFAPIATLLIIMTFKGHSPFHRYQPEQDLRRHDHRETTVHPLQTCSCYMNYIRKHSFNGSSEAVQIKVAAQDRTVTEKSTITKLLPPAILKNVEKTTDTIDNPPMNYLQEPIDTHLFSYIHNPEMTCFHTNGSKMDVYLVFFVLSAPGNFVHRDAIRSSYGSRDSWPTVEGAQVVTVFLLASTGNAGLQDKIDIESNKYGDIVQESFVDSYLNLTRKTIMGLKWVKSHCRHAQFAMKIDDDTSIIQRRILSILHDAPHIRYTLGFIFKKPIVNRDKKDKFYMSKEYYPDDHFPSYPNGHGYVMSTDVVEAVFNVAITIPLFPWEDVFFGTCIHRLDIELNHDNNYLYWGSYKALMTGNKDDIAGKHVMATDIPPEDMVRFFKRFMTKES
ncbi:beta-1,3-galactosyltransferase 5 [Strongylocentrotus purpuratus]|uniref:Hexosyltransferase n=1 Tax=Strongylocentrotus purpuratus TaxID=7668 RepID=A0A7M7GHG9_STRPU|nr:beta-1,3-galactosyltransferase 5 [Strongylocentrotus purpuratus]